MGPVRLAVGTGMQAVIEHTLAQPGNEEVRSVNAVVGETNDSSLNDIRAHYTLTPATLRAAIEAAYGGAHTHTHRAPSAKSSHRTPGLSRDPRPSL